MLLLVRNMADTVKIWKETCATRIRFFFVCFWSDKRKKSSFCLSCSFYHPNTTGIFYHPHDGYCFIPCYSCCNLYFPKHTILPMEACVLKGKWLVMICDCFCFFTFFFNIGSMFLYICFAVRQLGFLTFI